MISKLQFMRESDVVSLKSNIKSHVEMYKNNDYSWVEKLDITSKKVFVQFGDNLEINLKMDIDKPSKTDIDNIKIFYNGLRFLSDSQATDERLWVGLSHSLFWDYMQYRWPLPNKDIDSVEKHILGNYFFGHAQVRSLLLNGLARLWWFGRLTYLESEENPYVLLDYMADDLNGKAYVLFATNFSSNKKLLKNFIFAIMDYEKEFDFKVDRQLFQYLIKIINKYGGFCIIDTLSHDKVKSIVYSSIDNYLNS